MNRHTIKNAIAATLVLACTFAASAAVNRYVNADIGDDDKYDGSSPTVVSDSVGPKKTLMGALSLAVSGDTVYAAAGVYSNGVYETKNANGGVTSRFRAYVKGGVVLQGEGPGKTFILGASDSTTGDGCGADAVSCVLLEYSSTAKKGGVIRGFTVCNGRDVKSTSYSDPGATGIRGNSWYNLAVDCTISNNVTKGRGGGVSNLSCCRCRFLGGNSSASVSASGSAYNVSSFVNCYFDKAEGGIYHPDSNIRFVNCTLKTSFYSLSGKTVNLYNCIVTETLYTHSSHHFHHCLISAAQTSGTIEPDSVVVTPEELDLDENGVPRKDSVAVDTGRVDYYEDQTRAIGHWAFDTQYDIGLDVDGVPRILNDGKIDIGAYEFDWRQAYADDLASRNVTVTDVTTNVYETTAADVAVPAGGSLAADWAVPSGKETKNVRFAFTADVASGATLTVTKKGEATALLTIPGGGGNMEFAFTDVGPQQLVFAVSGEGAAVLSGFWNSKLVKISDANGGIAVTGAALGGTELVVGESLDLTIARTDTPEILSSGLDVNGDFFSFVGETADRVFETHVAYDAADLTIAAVYPPANVWYVDEKGDDQNDGRKPFLAKQTLAAAAAIENLRAGDTIHAAAGTYSNGVMEVTNSSGVVTARFRVIVPAGVLLEGEGADKTFIVGAADTSETKINGYGCGPKAARCVKLAAATSVLKGFTVCKGRCMAADYSNLGGGVVGTGSSKIVDCIITDNVGYRGGASYSGDHVGCKIFGNRCLNTGAAGIYCPTLTYNCVIGDGCYSPEGIPVYVNCTTEASLWGDATHSVSVYNSIVKAGVQATGKYYNCLITGSLEGAKFIDATSRQVSVDELNLDANLLPLAGSVAIDAGSNALYEASLPTSHWAYDQIGYDADFSGLPRVFNARIDVGACEYDWRGDYARTLSGGRGLSVAAASPGVTNAVDGVVLTPEASAVTLSWNGQVAGRATLATTVSGEGALTVMVNGVAVAPDAEGTYAFDLPEGLTKIDVSFAGTGSARLVSFDGPKAGLLLLVR